MNSKKIVLAALGATFIIGASAPVSFAAGPRHADRGMHREVMFVQLLKKADSDKDGQVSKAEFDARQEAIFTALDADQNGSITPGEFRAYRKAQWEEFRKNNPRAERRTNGEDTAATAENAEREGRRHEGRRYEARGEGRHWGNRHGAPMRGSMLIRMADTDENGQISKEEFAAAGGKIFSRLDRNEDGVISIDDMPDRPFR